LNREVVSIAKQRVFAMEKWRKSLEILD